MILDLDFFRSPPRARAWGLSPGPWPKALAQGLGPGPWPRALALGPGPRPWPRARAQGLGPGPGPRARAHPAPRTFIFLKKIEVVYTTGPRQQRGGNAPAMRRHRGGKDNSTPAEDLHNKNPSLALSEKQIHPRKIHPTDTNNKTKPQESMTYPGNR